MTLDVDMTNPDLLPTPYLSNVRLEVWPSGFEQDLTNLLYATDWQTVNWYNRPTYNELTFLFNNFQLVAGNDYTFRLVDESDNNWLTRTIVRPVNCAGGWPLNSKAENYLNESHSRTAHSAWWHTIMVTAPARSTLDALSCPEIGSYVVIGTIPYTSNVQQGWYITPDSELQFQYLTTEMSVEEPDQYRSIQYQVYTVNTPSDELTIRNLIAESNWRVVPSTIGGQFTFTFPTPVTLSPSSSYVLVPVGNDNPIAGNLVNGSIADLGCIAGIVEPIDTVRDYVHIGLPRLKLW
jgi:hypothetical protein